MEWNRNWCHENRRDTDDAEYDPKLLVSSSIGQRGDDAAEDITKVGCG